MDEFGRHDRVRSSSRTREARRVAEKERQRVELEAKLVEEETISRIEAAVQLRVDKELEEKREEHEREVQRRVDQYKDQRFKEAREEIDRQCDRLVREAVEKSVSFSCLFVFLLLGLISLSLHSLCDCLGDRRKTWQTPCRFKRRKRKLPEG